MKNTLLMITAVVATTIVAPAQDLALRLQKGLSVLARIQGVG
jgi:hypothetical protein